jgi:hypothetical protein
MHRNQPDGRQDHPMEEYSQQKALDMERGLYLIKYEASEGSGYPPEVRIAAEEGSESKIELILSPDVRDAVLWSPGATLVARATGKSRLRVLVAAAEPRDSIAVRVQVIPLSDDPGRAKEHESARLDLSEFRVLGHVAGRGDVIADSENWVGGPLAPSRIEGIAVQWPDKPRDLTLRYAVTVGGPRPVSGRLVETGSFAGTRGRALPLVGATLEIDGPAALGHQLMVESIFLGSPQSRIVGQRVVLAGPTGREPLVGLRLRIESEDPPKSVRQIGQTPRPKQSEDMEPEKHHPDQRPARRFTSGAILERDNELGVASAVASTQGKRAGRVRVFRSRRSGQLQPVR